MKTFPAAFEVERLKGTGSKPFWFWELTISSTDYYLAGRELAVPDFGTTIACINSLDEISQGISGAMDEFSVTQISIGIIRGTTIDEILLNPVVEDSPAILYLWYAGCSDAPQQMFTGYVRDIILSDKTATVTIQDKTVRLENKYIGTKVDSVTYANADPDDVGKVIPIPFGTVSKIPSLCVYAVAPYVYMFSDRAVTSVTNVYARNNKIADINIDDYCTVYTGGADPPGIVSTYALAYTVADAYTGGVLTANGDIHFIPLNAVVGQKISSAGVVSTYALAYTVASASYGGVLAANGDIHFIPFSAVVGQKISSAGIVSTYALAYTVANAYTGGVLAANGDIHFIPYSATVGQKISSAGVVSTYALAYTHTSAYFGGVLALNGDIHFVPDSATVGQKISSAGVVSTYALAYTLANGYLNGVLAANGDIHFIPFSATVGQKISSAGVVSTYALAYTVAGAYAGGVLTANGDIHFIPFSATVGQKISSAGVVSTYALTYTVAGAYIGGVLASDGDIYFIPYSAPVGQKIDILTQYSGKGVILITAAQAANIRALLDISLTDPEHPHSVDNMQITEGTTNTPIYSSAATSGYQCVHAIGIFNNSAPGNRAQVTMTVSIVFRCSYSYDAAINLMDDSNNRVLALWAQNGITDSGPKMVNYTFELTSAYFQYNRVEAVICSSNVFISVELQGAMRTIRLSAATTVDHATDITLTQPDPSTAVSEQILVDCVADAGTPAGVMNYILTECGESNVTASGTFAVSAFAGVINEYATALKWLNRLAWQCWAWFDMSTGIPRLVSRLPSLSVKMISTCKIDANGVRQFTLRKTSVDEVVNRITLLYNRDWTKSGTEAYQSSIIVNDSGSQTIYGIQERPELFMLDFITSPSDAAAIAAYALADIKHRRWLMDITVFQEYFDVEFGDNVTLSGFGFGKVLSYGLVPGDYNQVDKIGLKVLVPPYSETVSIYALAYTGANVYFGGVLASNGDIHFVPFSAVVGQKINSAGVVSTYALVYTVDYAYAGGVLAANGDIHFVPHNATVGQKISSAGVVSTYALAYTVASAYRGGVLALNGDIHFIPFSATVGQKISSAGVVSTYALAYTVGYAYAGGVLASDGDIYFIPYNAVVGQKISSAGVVSTYALAYTVAGAYAGGVLALNGDIHFIPNSAAVGQKISSVGVVSTYVLAYTGANVYFGGVLALNGDIHFIPFSATVGQKISSAGVVSTYALTYTVAGAYIGGVLTANGDDIHFIPYSASVGQKISFIGLYGC